MPVRLHVIEINPPGTMHLVAFTVAQCFGQIPEAIAHQIDALIRPYLDVVLFCLNRNEPGVCW